MNKLLILVLAISLVACGNSQKKNSRNKNRTNIVAAGATFPLPYYNMAFRNYKDSTGISVTYGGIGSGGGIRSLKDKIVSLKETPILLTKKEFEILTMLAKSPNHIFSREEILSKVWQEDGYVLERTVDVHITRLRKKLGEFGKHIANRSGYGYCLES